MSDGKKSTDPGLSAAERKEIRSREAKEAIADHEEAQRPLRKNHERLRAERRAREAAETPMFAPLRSCRTIRQAASLSLRKRNGGTVIGEARPRDGD